MILDAAINRGVIRGTLPASCCGEQREFHGWLELKHRARDDARRRRGSRGEPEQAPVKAPSNEPFRKRRQ
jgi:hypothetical protein